MAALTIVAGLAGLQACSNDDDNGGGGGGGNGSVAIALSPTSATVQQGGSTVVTGTITRSGGFSGNVTLSVTGEASGVTGTVSSGTVTGNSATVTLTASSSAAVGADTLVVHITGSGVAEATARFVLHVVANNPDSRYIVSVPDSAITIVAGANGTRLLTLVRTNFTGAVILSGEGLPPGTTIAFTPVGDNVLVSTATFTVGASTVPGTYHLVMRGTASGLGDVTIPITLTVLPSGTSGGFTASIPDSSFSIAAGVTGHQTVTFVRTNFTNAIALAAEGLPAGATASFTTVGSGIDTSYVVFTIPDSIAPGAYAITLRATAPGQPDVTIPLHLTITAVGTNPGYGIAVSPTTVNMVQNNTQTTSVMITRTNGFADSVTLTATGAPPELSATFLPSATTTGDSVTLSFTSTAALPLGTYPITVHATAPSGTPILDSALVTVVVAARAGVAVRLDYSTCAVGDQPIWLAVQDGSGAWMPITPTGNVYSFNITQPTGGLAVVTASGATTHALSVFYATSNEFTGYTGTCAMTPGATNTVTGTVAGLTDATDLANVSIGGATAVVVPAASSSFTISNALGGLQDLVGFSGSNMTPSPPRRGVIRRDQTVSASSSVGTVDFTGAESFSAANGNLTLGGIGSDSIFVSMFYNTGAACVSNPLYAGLAVTPVAGVVPIYGVPATAQRPTDFHSLLILAVSPGDSSSRLLLSNFHSLSNFALNLGAPITPTVSNVTGASAYKRLQVSGTLPSDYQTRALYYSDLAGNSVTVLETAMYGGSSSFAIITPDLSGLPGFNGGWPPAAGPNVTWTVTGTSGALTPGSRCTEGTTFKTATTSGTL